ncbi:MAG: hypothetical protein J5372_06935 [Lachnospiraceae bacterium]|nr:hypothetical protein [Lachnospiraceae bacterium]
MKNYSKRLIIILTLIITVLVFTACSGDDTKSGSKDSNDLVDSLTGVNYAKYVDQSREAEDKMIYDELVACFNVASTTPESYVFCQKNAPITATINNDGVTVVDKNGEKLDMNCPFMKDISDVAGSDFTTSMKTKTDGAEYKITMKEDITVEKTKAP